MFPPAVTPTSDRFAEAVPTTGWPSLLVSDVPLQEVVPGFVDTITTLVWSHNGVEVWRWSASQPGPETVLSLRHGDGGLSRSVDASGRWFAEIQRDSGLTVHHLVDGAASEELRPADDERAWAPVWHDTRQGRLAWLACRTEDPGSVVALYSADVTDGAAQPVGVPLVDFTCEHPGVWLARWGDWGMLLHSAEGSGTTEVLLDAEGIQIAEGRLSPDGQWFVGAGPDGTTVWTEGTGRTGASSFLLSSDGLRRRPVPGLAQGERLESALGSPDGSLLALVPDLAATFGSVVRIVGAESGSVVAEIEEPSWWVTRMVWSTDGRFLVYERWPDVTAYWAGVPQDVELVFYDTETEAGVALSLPGYAPALRSAG